MNNRLYLSKNKHSKSSQAPYTLPQKKPINSLSDRGSTNVEGPHTQTGGLRPMCVCVVSKSLEREMRPFSWCWWVHNERGHKNITTRKKVDTVDARIVQERWGALGLHWTVGVEWGGGGRMAVTDQMWLLRLGSKEIGNWVATITSKDDKAFCSVTVTYFNT